MTKVERVAREMCAIYCGITPSMLEHAGDDFLALARWHLREIARAERRGRGKTVGFVALSWRKTSVAEPTIKAKPWQSDVIGSVCARVVLVPKPQNGRER